MYRWSERPRWETTLTLLGLLLLAVTGCASEPPAPAPVRPTPELAVVVFATEKPATSTPEATDAPTPAATVGFGVQGSDGQETDNSQATAGASSLVDEVSLADPSPANSPANRPRDVNPLTGLKVDDPAVLRRRPLMVRVGNDPDARHAGADARTAACLRLLFLQGALLMPCGRPNAPSPANALLAIQHSPLSGAV